MTCAGTHGTGRRTILTDINDNAGSGSETGGADMDIVVGTKGIAEDAVTEKNTAAAAGSARF
jgi:hypothetical protein